jgi:hypothetical protein
MAVMVVVWPNTPPTTVESWVSEDEFVRSDLSVVWNEDVIQKQRLLVVATAAAYAIAPPLAVYMLGWAIARFSRRPRVGHTAGNQ